MTVTYRGFDLLDLEPNSRDDGQIVLSRSSAMLDSLVGPVEVNARDRQPVGSKPFNWFQDGRAAAAEYDTFLAARCGRAVPFWLPNWRGDVELAAPIGSTDVTILIKSCDYSRLMFTAAGRRHLAIMLNNGTSQLYREILAAVDNGNETETLTINSSLGVTAPVATTFISWLLFCRLETDRPERHWHHTNLAEATIPVREIALEAPVT